MYKGRSFLAVIPARKNSKGFPNKNSCCLLGRPMFQYVAEAIQDSGIFDRIITTTDDPKVAEIARSCGVEVPFMRPAELAASDSLVIDAMVHALGEIKEKYDYVLLLAPTSPLVESFDIKMAADKLLDENADMVVSICKADLNSSRYSFVRPMNTNLTGVLSNASEKESDIKRTERYCLNGAIYLAKYEVFANKKYYYDTNIYGYVMPCSRSIDIDNAWDFELAEYLLRKRKNGKSFWRTLYKVGKRLVCGR
jgi:CMP-N,N'-diacetyllegionaminic acid synthase